MYKKIFQALIIGIVFILSLAAVQAARLPTVGEDSNQWGNILNDYLQVSHDANGTLKATLSPTFNGLTLTDRLIIDNPGPTFSGASSRQTVQADANFGGYIGSSYGGAVMGNALGTLNATSSNSIIAGLIGKFNIEDVGGNLGPKGAIVGEVGEDATGAKANGAFIAVLGGNDPDTGAITPGAAYTVRYLNVNPASKFDYGLDLLGAQISGHQPVTYGTADIRLSNGSTISNNDGTLTITEGTIVLAGDLTLNPGVINTAEIANDAVKQSKLNLTDITLSDFTNDFGYSTATNDTIQIGTSQVTGLGPFATKTKINNSDWEGTALAVANGGTGATTDSGARTNLGLVIGTDVQAFDAGLNSIAGLTTAADKMIYTTASDTYAVTDLTTFGRSLIDDANAGAGRTTLGLVIGTDVQAFDATLTSIGALGTAADKIAYTTGVDTWAETALTGFGRTLIDDADAGTARTTLGLVAGGSGDIWVEKAGDTMTGALILDDTSLQIQEGVDTMTITVPALTAARAVTFPDAAGEVSLLGQTIESAEITDGTILAADISLGTDTGLDYDDFTTGTVADARIVSTITRDSEIDTSAEIAGIVTDETGSGALVFGTSPTLTTPNIGVATATSINKLTITAPTTSATLTIADGKTLTVSNTLTFTGTDSSSVAFGAGGTVAYTGGKLDQFAATTSAELAGVVSDEQGSGALVFATSPTLTTPNIGAATATSINIGSGTIITKHLSATGAVDFAAITAPNCNTQTIAVTDASVGDTVVLGPPSTIESGISSWSGFVSAANTVTIKACAVAANTDAASATWRVDVWKH